MADHLVMQIVDAILARTGAMTEIPAANQFTDRVYPLDLYPTLTVLVTADAPAAEETQGMAGNANAQVLVEIRHKANVGEVPGLSRKLWNSEADLRARLILAGDPKLAAAGATTAFEWTGSSVELAGESEKPAGKVSVQFVAHHRYLSYDPTTG